MTTPEQTSTAKPPLSRATRDHIDQALHHECNGWWAQATHEWGLAADEATLAGCDDSALTLVGYADRAARQYEAAAQAILTDVFTK